MCLGMHAHSSLQSSLTLLLVHCNPCLLQGFAQSSLAYLWARGRRSGKLV